MVKLKTIRGVNVNGINRMLGFREQVKIIQTEAEPIKKRILDKNEKKELPATGR
ncbi:MAG: hypothetical protein Q8N12_02610 [Thermodesulfovibrionales bacterium]|nr:hypothetical protein [Nitrospinota bacterium]MCG2710175.1 hypothetical protein [Thermodesulfovibrionales bacterium]MCG2813250.1 hypothetical protein [Thermodesulfovibrionales bacterium]MDP3048307.1 hypothetical protein [Thermodesulfovibrionales bacterium]